MKKIIGLLCFFLGSLLLHATNTETLDKELKIAFPPNGHKLSFDPAQPLMFVWTDSLRDHTPYNFILVEMKSGQSVEEALKLNAPLSQIKEINNYYTYYPWTAPWFKNNVQYAWQVTSLKDGSRVTASFYFTQSAPQYQYILKYNNRFAELKEKLDGSYQMAFDKYLMIHYTELYQVAPEQGLRFRILDKNRQILVQTDDNGNVINNTTIPKVPIRRRENWVTINLNQVPNDMMDYGPFYYLEVWNGKGEYHFLRFRCDYSLPSYNYQVAAMP